MVNQPQTVYNRYLVRFAHPTLFTRTSVINAATLEDARAIAEASIAGTAWTIFSITELPPLDA